MIISPCIGVCTEIDGACIGCFRTTEQISKWLYYNDEEREKIMKECITKMSTKMVKNNN